MRSGENSIGRRRLLDVLLSVTAAVRRQLTPCADYRHAVAQGVVKSTVAGSGANCGYIELTYCD